jgi:DNA-binding NarL/FixJ family response regulator
LIKIFSVSKADYYIRIIEPLLNEHNIFVTGSRNLTKDALQFYKESGADIVLLDAHSGACSLTTKEILADFLSIDDSIKVILVTGFFDPVVASNYIEMGAKGYFYRNVQDIAVIVDCIKTVYKS